MTQTRPIQTKALSAVFIARGSSLSTALAQVGEDIALTQRDTIDDAVVAKIARRFGLTFEKLCELASAHAS